jgi:hypothetical protein
MLVASRLAREYQIVFMNVETTAARRLAEWLGNLWGTFRMGLSLPLSEVAGSLDEPVDAKQEFDGWLRGDPFVTKDPASRYGNHSPGYITGNGLGSLEIGHSDD